MRTVSTAFLAQLREPHVVVVEADVLPAGGGTPEPLAITGGTLVADRTAQIRRTASITLPAASALELAELPFGAYVELRRGVRFANLETELVVVGTLRVDNVGGSRPDGAGQIGLVDRMAQVRDEPLLTPYAAGGKIASAAIVDLVNDVFPTVPTNVSTVSEPTLADVTFTSDRARAVADLAASIDAEAYFDADGELVVAPQPSLSSPPAWTIDAGVSGVLVSSDDQLERAGVANGVLVRGQATADVPPIEVLVVDDTAGSRTLWGGPFGRVAVIVESTAVQSLAQATAVGEAELARRLGLTRTLSLRSVPNPALEPGDVVDVVLADGELERHLIDRVSIPLDAVGSVELSTRSTLTLPLELGVVAGAAAWRELAGARGVE